MRILKGWTKKERKELEDAKYNGFNNAIYLINGIADDDCTSLTEKYINGSPDEDNQMARDIADFYCGNAKFPEQKYYVQLIKNNDSSYLNRNTLKNFCTTSSYQPDEIFQTKFTEDEIKDIDPRYMAFAVPVEDDDE
ncbi:DUF1642 domain-containing protein [Companilactobacillus farciminis]|uniref:DUF1642 domain-containing protein n=1 Tax=Companilactobacillus farciminis TaxID=1612 RepID=UPI001914EAA0|nr:DUF1642 domain-containing protein [Companilactobacillus farciminis]